jgi:hypothetical protein
MNFGAGNGKTMKTQIEKLVAEGVVSNQQVKDATFQEITDLTWESLQEALDTVNHVLDSIPLKDMEEQGYYLMLKITTCLSDLSAATHLLTAGFHHPAAVILRVLVENLAVAVAVNAEESLFEAFKNDDLDKPKMVTKAKKHFSELGALYGQLTQKFTHEPYSALGRAVCDVGNGKTALLLIPPVGRDHFVPQFTILSLVSLIAHLLAQISEWCFAASLKDMRHWEKKSDVEMISKDCGIRERTKKISAILMKSVQTHSDSLK